ncbi:MAG: hypothetical protein AB7S48_12340 [Bacteroidales bacterium]
MKLSNIRKCPVCGHKMSIKEYLSEVFLNNANVWQCGKCDAFLTYKRYKLTFILALLPIIFMFNLANLFDNKLIGYLSMIPMAILWALIIFIVTSFKEFKIKE